MRKNYFITAVVGVLNFKSKQLSFARAGHNLPLYFHAATGETTWLNPNGLGIGMAHNGVFSRLIEEKTVPLEGGATSISLGPASVLLRSSKRPCSFMAQRAAGMPLPVTEDQC